LINSLKLIFCISFLYICVDAKKALLIIALWCLCLSSFSQTLTATAGNNVFGCYNGSLTIGGSPTASGGRPPYLYSWQPSTFLNSTSVANPTITSLSSEITYTVVVKDSDEKRIPV